MKSRPIIKRQPISNPFCKLINENGSTFAFFVKKGNEVFFHYPDSKELRTTTHTYNSLMELVRKDPTSFVKL